MKTKSFIFATIIFLLITASGLYLLREFTVWLLLNILSV